MLSNLKETMARENVSMEDVSRALGIHRNSVSHKVNGETGFTFNEAHEVWRRFFKRYDFIWLFFEVPKQDSA